MRTLSAELLRRPAVESAPLHLQARANAMLHLAVCDGATQTSGRGPSSVMTAAVVAAAIAELEADIKPDERAFGTFNNPDSVNSKFPRLQNASDFGRLTAVRASDGWRELAPLRNIDVSDPAARLVAAGAEPPPSPWLAAKPFALRRVRGFDVAVPAFTAIDGTVRVDPSFQSSPLFATVNRSLRASLLQETWRGNPLAKWNEVALAAAQASGLSDRETERLLTLLNVALADATLVAEHNRFVMGSWRYTIVDTWENAAGAPPLGSQVFRDAVFDGGERGTAQVSSRRVLVAPSPDYPSMAAVLAATAEAILSGTRIRGGFSLAMESDPANAVRSYGNIGEAARECAFVATLDGRHTRESVIAGYKLGQAVGREVLRRSPLTR